MNFIFKCYKLQNILAHYHHLSMSVWEKRKKRRLYGKKIEQFAASFFPVDIREYQDHTFNRTFKMYTILKAELFMREKNIVQKRSFPYFTSNQYIADLEAVPVLVRIQRKIPDHACSKCVRFEIR